MREKRNAHEVEAEREEMDGAGLRARGDGGGERVGERDDETPEEGGEPTGGVGGVGWGGSGRGRERGVGGGGGGEGRRPT